MLRSLGPGLERHGNEVGRESADDLVWGPRLGKEEKAIDLGRGAAGVGSDAGEEPVEEQTEGMDVGGRADRPEGLRIDLFRCHPRRCAGAGIGTRQPRGRIAPVVGQQFGEAEVGELRPVADTVGDDSSEGIGCEADIRRGDVTVEDVPAVSGIGCAGEAADDLRREPGVGRAGMPGEPVGQ